MMTLKDIKVSRNRIPVQNAIWLRPIGNLAFKIYYPHGGDWKEMQISEGEGEDTIKDIEKEIKDVKASLSDLSKKVDDSLDSILKSISKINVRVSTLDSTIKDLYKSVDRLYESVDFTKIALSKTLDVNAENQPMNLSDFGIDKYCWDAIVDGVVRKATIPGFDSGFDVRSYGMVFPTGFVSQHFADFTLLTNEKYIAFIIEAIPYHPTGLPAYFNYNYTGLSLDITDEVFVLENAIAEKTDTTIEYLEQYGITIETIRNMAEKGNITVLFKDTTLPFIGTAEYQDGADTYFSIGLHSYDAITNKTKYYEITGAFQDEVWLADIICYEVDGNPEEE